MAEDTTTEKKSMKDKLMDVKGEMFKPGGLVMLVAGLLVGYFICQATSKK